MAQESGNYQLRSCVWELTLACCFRCKYCGSGGGVPRENELTTEECLDVARQLADLGCSRVSLIGGEVFLRPDWAEISAALIKRGVQVAIITNGYQFTEEILQTLHTVQIESVAISLDGPEPIHDKYRQQGSFRRGVRAIHDLAQHGIPVSMITTLNHENAELLESFYHQVQQWPIFAWQLQACSPMGNAAKSGINYRFDVSKVIDFVGAQMFDAPFILGIADNIGYYTSKEGYLRGNLSGHAVFTGCGAGLSSIGIDSVGNVRGCESMYDDFFIEGNLRNVSLKEIWESPDTFRYNRMFQTDMLTGECSNCFYGRICAGGCRSYNYFVHRNLYESPSCGRNLLSEIFYRSNSSEKPLLGKNCKIHFNHRL